MKARLIHTFLSIAWLYGCGTQPFVAGSAANEPTIKTNSRIITSKTLTPKRFDFICFRAQDEKTGAFTAVFRLCGMPGDTVEIRRGELHVNGIHADHQFTLRQYYKFPFSDIAHRMDIFPDINLVETRENDTMAYAYLDNRFIKEHRLKAERVLQSPDQKNENMQKIFGQPWNIDNFGPVAVPKDHFFVLGDNRYQAADSRFIGFVPASSLVATVVRNEQSD